MTRPTQLISGDGPDYFTPPRPATNTTEVVLADTTFAHDANGNLTADASFFYQYDKADRLTNVIARATGARVFSATYDPLGRRREVVRADGTIDRYVYFPGSFLVLAVLDENNAVKEFYTHGPDLGGDLDTAGGIAGNLACTYLQSTNLPIAHLHPDAMGNIILATSDDGSVAGTYHYTPFGRPITQSSPYRPRFLFSSKEFDPETSLSYYGFRYYSPSLARWLTRDPIGEVDEISLYCFINNNAHIGIDTWGLTKQQQRVPIIRHRQNLIIIAGQSIGYGSVQADFYDIIGYTLNPWPPTTDNQTRAFISAFLANLENTATAEAIDAIKNISADEIGALIDEISQDPASFACNLACGLAADARTLFEQFIELTHYYYEGDLVSAAYTLGEISGKNADRFFLAATSGMLKGITKSKLYRGVPAGTPRAKAARQGLAKPRGNALDTTALRKHVLGEDVNAGVTSWSRDRNVARRFSGSNGIILEVDESLVQTKIVPRPRIMKYADEQEVLLKGTIRATPTDP